MKKMKKIFFGLALSLFLISNNYCQVNDTIRMEIAEMVEDSIFENPKIIKTLDSYLYDIDKFTGEKTYYNKTQVLSFARYVKKNISSQYVNIRVEGSTLNYGCYGVSILFKNGQKLIRSKEKVDSDYSNGKWVYSAFFTPTANEINLLRNQKAVYVKLYIYDANLDISNSNNILEDAKVMLKVPNMKKK